VPDPYAFVLRLDTPPRIDTPELIDDVEQPYADFRASMSDVRRANRFLGGTVVVTRQVRRWLQAAHQKQVTEVQTNKETDPSKNQTRDENRNRATVCFLDVATGSGDIPHALLRVAERTRVDIRVAALDFSPPILRYASEQVGHLEPIRLVRGDAFHLPFADNSVDYALCSLAFHHWGFEGCIDALREMERVSRCGWLVNDLRRAWSAWFLIRLVMTFAGVNRLTRHDAPASVLRAYALDEYAAMPRALGLQVGRDVRIERSLFYRVALIREKE
jgi:ubiquinone/menaquinone biosynthesis C-methylase UbiE